MFLAVSSTLNSSTPIWISPYATGRGGRKKVRKILRHSENHRLTALQDMFERFGYPDLEAIARARILYYMQIGYDDAQLNAPMAARSRLVPAYLLGFTGKTPTEEEITGLQA
jgi:hypothetical protein